MNLFKYNTFIIFNKMLASIIALFFTLSTILGQEISEHAIYRLPTFPPSPNVVEMTKYLNQPVNFSSGVPVIEVPIYTIQVGNISVPIGVNYHAGGVKVPQEASNVGLNWSLNAGGVVSRQIRGIIDDLYLPNNIFGGAMYATMTLKDVVSTPEDDLPALDLQLNEEMRQFDQQIDLFNYSIPSVGGTQFVFDQEDKMFYELERSNNKIEYQTGSGGRIYQWTITDTNGTKYIFGEEIADAVNYPSYSETNFCILQGSDSLDPNGHAEPIGISSWYLRKIIDLNGNEVNFEYGTNSEVEYYSKAPQITNGGSNSIGEIYSKSLVEEKYLKKITFTNGFVEFTYGDRIDLKNSKKLEKIEIYRKKSNNLNELIKQISFNHSYHNYSANYNGTNHPSNVQNYNRLKLDSIEIKGSLEDDNPQKYQFEYDNTPLPPKFSYAKDYWDGFNGKNNHNSTPSLTFYYSVFNIYIDGGSSSVERHVEKDYVTAGTLTKITYPTGGYTKYEYEPNSVSSYKYLGGYYLNDSHKIFIKNIKNPYTIKNYKFSSEPTDGDWVNCPHTISGNDVEFNCPITIDKTLQSNFRYNFSMPFPQGYAGCGVGGDPQTDGYCLNYSYSCPEGSISEPTSQYPPEGEIVCNYKPATITNLDGSPLPNWMFIEPGEYLVNVKFNGNPSLFAPNSQIRSSFNLDLDLKYDETPDIRVVGGLRVAKIENYDNNNNLISQKEYEYEFLDEDEGDLLSSGVTMLPSFGFYEGMNITPTINIGSPLGFVLIASDSNINPSAKGNVAYHKIKETFINIENPNEKYSKIYSLNNSILRFDNTHTFYRPYVMPNLRIIKDMQVPWNTKPIEEHSFNNLGENVMEAYSSNLLNHISDKKIFAGVHFQPVSLKVGGGVYLNHGYVFDYQEYSSYSQLVHQETIEHLPNEDNSIINRVFYNYSPNNPLLISSETTTNSLGETLKTEYYYPQDLTSSYQQSSIMQKLVDRNQIANPVITKNLNEATVLNEQRVHYSEVEIVQGEKMILPKSVYIKKGMMGTTAQTEDRKITYDRYDHRGNLLQYTMENGIPVSIIWGYRGQYPIAKIEGKTYSSIENLAGNLIQISENETLTPSSFEQLQELEQALVTGYIYKPLVGVTTIIQPNGQYENYNYDNAGRLKSITDESGNILKQVEYNYRD